MSALAYHEDSPLLETVETYRDKVEKYTQRIELLKEIAELARDVDCNQGGLGIEKQSSVLKIKATSMVIDGPIEKLIQHHASVDVKIEYDNQNQWYSVEMTIRPSAADNE